MTKKLLKKLSEISARVNEVTPVPYKMSPIVFLEYNEKNELTENAKVMNEYLKLGFSAARDLPQLLSSLEIAVKALEQAQDFQQEMAELISKHQYNTQDTSECDLEVMNNVTMAMYKMMFTEALNSVASIMGCKDE